MNAKLTANQKLVLKTIIEKKEISQTELVELTTINKASMSEITQVLKEKDLINESRLGEASSLGGRRPILLSFNYRFGIALAIDCSPRYIHSVASWLDGEIVNEKYLKIKRNTNSQEYQVQLIELIEDLINHLPNKQVPILGLSLAIHGQVKDNYIIFSPNYKLNPDTHKVLTKKYSFPIFLENEANLSALGEYVFHYQTNQLVSLNIRSGIGAGIVKNGLIETGMHGLVGEIGHTIIQIDGRLCPCGNHGCLEQYASTDILEDQIEQITDAPLDYSTLNNLFKSDPKVRNVLVDHAKYLSIAINNISAYCDPQIIIINCPIYDSLPELFQIVKENLNGFVTANIQLYLTSVPNHSSLLGGVAISIMSYLEIDNIQLT